MKELFLEAIHTHGQSFSFMVGGGAVPAKSQTPETNTRDTTKVPFI